MGSQVPKAHLLWYVELLKLGCGIMYGERETDKKANIPQGKILKDEDTVETYKIEEKGFVVCMVNKV